MTTSTSASPSVSSGVQMLAQIANASQSPSLTLEFYAHGVIMRTATTAYPVDPDRIAKVLSGSIHETFSTGLLDENTLFVWQRGDKKIIISWRKPQMTGLWLEGSEDAIRIPLPGMVMKREYTRGGSVSYSFWAAKRRPSAKTPLYHCPLPNVHHSGSCWGSVSRPPEAVLESSNTDLDWQNWLGSPFGNHSVSGKSKAYQDDIRQLMLVLHKDKVKRYPVSDLIPSKIMLGDIVKRITEEKLY